MRPVLLLCVSSLFCPSADLKHLEPHWVFVGHPLRWELPPPEVDSRASVASGAIIVLYPSGDFGEVWCTLFRAEDGRVSISRGDSHLVRVGRWSLEEGKLLIRARVVYTDALPVSKPVPGPETMTSMSRAPRPDTWTVNRYGDVREFRRLPQLTDLTFLATMIACDRTSWDGTKWVERAESPCTDQR